MTGLGVLLPFFVVFCKTVFNMSLRSCDRVQLEIVMAVQPLRDFKFDVSEIQELRLCVAARRAILVRRQRQEDDAEIRAIIGRQIGSLDVLLSKVA